MEQPSGGNPRKVRVLVSACAVAVLVTTATTFAAVASASAVSASAVEHVRSVQQPVWQWPLDGTPQVVRPFAPPPRPWLAGHRGVDLAGRGGAHVRAAGAGRVVYAGVLAGRGVVSVDHTAGLRTTYEPVTAVVRPGQVVEVGTVLGTLDIGHPGCPVAACLHWGLRRGEVYLDPLLLVRPRLRLKPLVGKAVGQARGWAWLYTRRSRSLDTWV